jgi:signal transduction histidine kinase
MTVRHICIAGLRFAIGLLVLAGWLISAPASTAAESKASTVRRILIVYENESTLFANREVTRGLHQSLSENSPTTFEFYSEYLDTVRFPDPDHRRRLTENLVAKYRNVALDVLVAVGPGALRFMLDHRGEIAPEVPLIFGGVSDESLKAISLPADVRGVLSRFDVIRTVDLARRLLPDAKRIVVLTGSSAFDHGWEASARRDLGVRYEGLDVTYLSGLSLQGFVEETRKFSPDTILLILTVFEDADGRKYIPRDATKEIASASGAPSFSVYSSYIGTGVVGGFIETFESVGVDMATLSRQVISQTGPGLQISPSTGRSTVHWPQMLRWDLDKELLPDDAEIRDYQPSIWEQYRVQILAIATVMLLQSATIAALIAQYGRRKRMAEQLALERLELTHLSRVQQLGELSGAFAHELNQPLTSILANAEAGERLLQSDPVDTEELKEILKDIASDDKRAAAIIAQLRRLMVKGEAKLEPLDLNRTIEATLALAHSELVARQTRVSFNSQQAELKVHGSVAQLQQLVLNLLLNAAESMSNLAAADRKVEIETRRRDDGSYEMSVSDYGPGLPPELRMNAFKPFVSTKDRGLGLGLAICRSIALAHGGTLAFDDARSPGARVVLTLPSA